MLTALEERFRDASSCRDPISPRASDPFPPLRRGGQGGGPGVTNIFTGRGAGFGGWPPLGPAELEGVQVSVMPCPPPLTPPSQGGEKDRTTPLSGGETHAPFLPWAW